MIGLIIVTHAGLASEFRAALEHIVGPQEQLVAISVSPNDDMAQKRTDILDAVAKVDSGKGAVILTDMFGGTPSNLAISVLDDVRVVVIAGINLPLLVKLAQVRAEKPLDEAVAIASDAARKYIKVASQELSGNG